MIAANIFIPNTNPSIILSHVASKQPFLKFIMFIIIIRSTAVPPNNAAASPPVNLNTYIATMSNTNPVNTINVAILAFGSNSVISSCSTACNSLSNLPFLISFLRP